MYGCIVAVNVIVKITEQFLFLVQYCMVYDILPIVIVSVLRHCTVFVHNIVMAFQKGSIIMLNDLLLTVLNIVIFY